jgi:hypothetical protein
MEKEKLNMAANYLLGVASGAVIVSLFYIEDKKQRTHIAIAATILIIIGVALSYKATKKPVTSEVKSV